MTTNLDEPLQFLGIVASKGFWNENTVQARRTACTKFFDILDEDQKNVAVRARQPGRDQGPLPEPEQGGARHDDR